MPTMEAKRKRHQAVGCHLMKKKKIYIYTLICSSESKEVLVSS